MTPRLSVLTEAISNATPRRAISSVADDPDVRAYRARHASLSQSLLEAKAQHARLVDERTRLQQSAFAQNVDALVHGDQAAAVDAYVSDVIQLDADITSCQSRIDALVTALPKVAELLQAAQRRAAAGVQEECDARAIELVGEMLPLVRQLNAFEDEFFALRGRTSYGPGFWPVPLRPMGQPLTTWLSKATAIAEEDRR